MPGQCTLQNFHAIIHALFPLPTIRASGYGTCPPTGKLVCSRRPMTITFDVVGSRLPTRIWLLRGVTTTMFGYGICASLGEAQNPAQRGHQRMLAMAGLALVATRMRKVLTRMMPGAPLQTSTSM